jgi:DNA-binding transcriptional MocR family regulator
MAIDPKLPIPVYFQLKTLLLEEILEGRYGLEGRLPTEHQLCERHGISRTPVTRALSELASEGVALERLLAVAAPDGLLPEAYDPDTGGWLARHWFAWPSAVLAALALGAADRPSGPPVGSTR